MANKTGKINHHPDYVEGKCRMMISSLENIIKLQNDTCHGLENESLNDLKFIESYAKFLQKGYIKEEKKESLNTNIKYANYAKRVGKVIILSQLITLGDTRIFSTFWSEHVKCKSEISVSKELLNTDKGYVLQDPDNLDYKWFVTEEFFNKNYEVEEEND